MPASNGSYRRPDDAGLLLVGHGSREPSGVREFLETARLVADLAVGLPIEPCFLEFAEPAIAAGFQSLVRRGARRIVVVPVLLFAAGHAQRDIPAAVAAAAAGSATRGILQSAHLGCHNAILRLSASRYEEAIAQHPRADDQDTVLVLVGRGSHDETATAEMRRFVELRAQAASVRHVRAGFVAMAEPKLNDVLDEAAACGARRIVVQPHLLFDGLLVERIGQTVERYAAEFPRIRWVTTGHLGPARLLATAVLDRAGEQLASKCWID